jgi:four helix bundle protein
MMKSNVIKEKSYLFVLRVTKACKYPKTEQKELVLSKRVLRSGTVIEALISKAEHAQSAADFIGKMNIVLKEANETDCWLMPLKDSNYPDEKTFETIRKDCNGVHTSVGKYCKHIKRKS